MCKERNKEYFNGSYIIVKLGVQSKRYFYEIKCKKSSVSFTVYGSKRFFYEIKCKKSSVSFTVYGRRHSKHTRNTRLKLHEQFYLWIPCGIMEEDI